MQTLTQKTDRQRDRERQRETDNQCRDWESSSCMPN